MKTEPSTESVKQLDPHKTIGVVKVDGREVGRKAVTAKNAQAYFDELTSFHLRQGAKSVTIEYEEDATAAMIGHMLSGGRRELPQ